MLENISRYTLMYIMNKIKNKNISPSPSKHNLQQEED